MATDWDPEQYRLFSVERTQPFLDLIGLIEPGARVGVDLGCGTGELTSLAAERLGLERITGIDSSPAMLAAASEYESGTVGFAEGDIGTWTSPADHDLVLASASLHWLADHRATIERWSRALRPGGQIAIQVPANAWMPSHTTASDVAMRPRYLDAFGAAGPPPDPVAVNVLEPEEYARLLHELGFVRQHVRLQVYGHLLRSSRDVVEWVKGASLTRFERVLPADVYRAFLHDYEAELLARIGEHSPYFFPFRRILMWGRLPG